MRKGTEKSSGSEYQWQKRGTGGVGKQESKSTQRPRKGAVAAATWTFASHFK